MDFTEKYNKYNSKYLDLFQIGGAGETVIEPLDQDDRDLLDNIIRVGKTYCDPEGSPVAMYSLVTALRHGPSGEILYGLASRSPMGSDAHAEPAVVSAARIRDPVRTNFTTIVCITSTGKFKAPCGSCRELLKHHFPHVNVIVPDPSIAVPTPLPPNYIDNLVKINIKYLLPYPYQNGDIREESKLDKNIDVTLK